MNYTKFCQTKSLKISNPNAAIAYAEEYLGNIQWPSKYDVKLARELGPTKAAERISADLERSGIDVDAEWTMAYALALETRI